MKRGDRVRYVGDWWPDLYGAIGTVTHVSVFGKGVSAVAFHIDGRGESTTWALWLQPISPLEELAEAADGLA